MPIHILQDGLLPETIQGSKGAFKKNKRGTSVVKLGLDGATSQKMHDSRTARRRWTIRLKAHGSYCSGYIPNCTSLVPGLHKSQTYVGEVYCNFSTKLI